ncbi:MAG: hypothetical protein COB54_07645 [Alphaproteobacteria bacterium]|nr:MAG: hypothetical protein COB54_07645 [Alphaproteobacteria bacterium]
MTDNNFKPIVLKSQQEHSGTPQEPEAFVPLVRGQVYAPPQKAGEEFKPILLRSQQAQQEPQEDRQGDEKGFLGAAVDTLQSIGSDILTGVRRAGQNIGTDLIEGGAETLHALGAGSDEAMTSFRDKIDNVRKVMRSMSDGDLTNYVDDQGNIDLDRLLEDKKDGTVTEGILGEVVQLSPVGIGAFKALTAVGVTTLKAGVAAEALAMAFSTNPDDEIIANLLPEDGDSTFAHTIRDVLATDPNDPDWVNRARKSIEVLGLGYAGEKLISGLRAAAARRANKVDGDDVPTESTEAPLSPESDLSAPTTPEDAPVTSASPEGLVQGSPEKVFNDFQKAMNDVSGEAAHGKDVFQTTPLNMSKVKTSDDVKHIMESMARLADDKVLADWSDIQTLAESTRLANELLLDPDDVLNTVEGMAFGSREHTAYLLAAKKISIGQHEATRDSISRVLSDGTDEALQEFHEKIILAIKTDNMIKQVQRSGARMTSAGRIELDGAKNISNLEDIDLSALADPTPEALRKLAGQLEVIPPENLPAWKRIFNRISTSKKWDITNEFFINAILSGPKTHLVNFLSNTTETFMKPLETIAGGALTGNKQVMADGINQYLGIAYSLKDSIRLMKAAAVKGEAVLDPLSRTDEAAQISAMGESRLAKALRLPTRALLTSDELFKQVNYRSKLFSMGMAKAPSDLARKERVQWALEYVSKGIDPKTGKAVNKEALQHAREATFTEELRKGTLSRTIQDASNKHPALKSIIPFIRTPTNLIKHQFRRVPGIGLLSKQMSDDIAAGGARRAAAIGKQAVGGVFTATGFMLAFNGQITGSGPTNPTTRAKLMETGWQPYAFKVTNDDGSVEYVSYKRGDPRLMIFGVMADAVGIMGNLGDDEQAELGAAILYSVSQNLSNKTYFKGIADASDALIGGDVRTIKRFLGQQLVGHTVPFSSAMRQTNQDPYLREVRSLVDHYANAIPGWSSTLEPRRNVMGEPIMNPAGVGLSKLNPFHGTKWKNDVVYEELAKFGGTIKNPPTKKGGVDLLELKNKKGQTAYDRWLEVVSTITIGTKGTLKESLESVVTSDRYLRELDDPDEDYNGSRRSQILGEIGRYRERAYKTLMKEFPDIREGQRDNRKDLMMKRLGFRDYRE